MPTPPPRPPRARRGLAVTLADATLAVRADGVARHILDGVTLHLPAGEFVAVVGASGSGKSTLVRAVAGLARLTGGEVRLAGVPLDALTLRADRRVAYLPQDVVVHEPLTPAAALGYSARLRGLGGDAGGPDALVESALDRVGLADRAGVPIAKLSGGQRKRVALAAELLGNPQLLLLDEPTSGLDPDSEAGLMALFRSLADEGRTVVCVTHAPARLHLCDRLVVMAEGACIFHGPPAAAPAFFGVSTADELYAAIATRPPGAWRDRFATAHPARVARPPAASPAAPSAPLVPVPTASAQAKIFIARYARLQLADPRALLLQAAQAPVIGLMVGATFGDIRTRFAEQNAADARQVLFVLVVAVLWCAGAGSAREVVKELPVVRHEARFGLDSRAYLASKFALLAALAAAQAAVLLLVVRWLCHSPGPADAQFLILAALAAAGVGLRLLVSAASGTSERAMTLLPVALIGLAVFSGGLARLRGPALVAAEAASPAYWALDGLKAPLSASLGSATYPGAPGTYQPPILGRGGPLALDALALAAQASALLAGSYLALRHRVRA